MRGVDKPHSGLGSGLKQHGLHANPPSRTFGVVLFTGQDTLHRRWQQDPFITTPACQHDSQAQPAPAQSETQIRRHATTKVRLRCAPLHTCTDSPPAFYSPSTSQSPSRAIYILYRKEQLPVVLHLLHPPTITRSQIRGCIYRCDTRPTWLPCTPRHPIQPILTTR
jgi:hypothetical protein